jgi:hypothetical protein
MLMLRAIEALLNYQMEPVRRAELLNQHKVWTERLKALR